MSKKSILILVVVLVTGMGAVWYGIREFNRKETSTSELDAIANFKADSLASKFESNDSVATIELGGKIVQLEGTIEESTMDNGILRVRLKGSDMSGIICQMETKDSSQLSNYKPGATVCLKGKCNTYQKVEMLPGGDLLLSNCVLTEYRK